MSTQNPGATMPTENAGSTNNYGGTTIKDLSCEVCNWMSGRYCGQDCKWHNNSSCSSNGSGGGGGGGGGGGECTTETIRYEGRNENFQTQWTYVTYQTCNGHTEVLGVSGGNIW